MNNTRFATAVHIMTLLADSPLDWLTSDWMAGSININPVMVRKELGNLKEAGLVISRQGKEGGAKLAKNPDQILISDIYKAVKNSEVLGKKHNSPNPACNIGKDINSHLIALFLETDELVINFLGNISLKEFTNKFK